MDPIVTLKAPAKLNLNLRITGLRKDGYHELETLFFCLEEPFDTLSFSPGVPGSGCTLTCDIPGLAAHDNLAHKAWVSFGKTTGFAPDLCIDIKKGIPTGAGLGGGSTDAASVLLYMNARAAELALSLDALTALAAKLGADVPFFLMNGPAKALGIGEKLSPVKLDFSGLTLVVACPDLHVDTAWAYREFDLHNPQFTTGLTTEDADNIRAVPASQSMFFNDFETVVFQAFPEIREIKEEFIRRGAAATSMSGSGASVFAWFRDNKKGRKAADHLETKQISTYVWQY